MRWSDVTTEPSLPQLRQFAIILAVLMVGWAIRHVLLTDDVVMAVDVGVIAIVIAMVGWVRPQLYRLIFMSWMIAVFPIAWMVSTLILGVLFFGFIMPVSLWFRVVGRDFLGRRPDDVSESYWIKKPPSEPSTGYLRQF